jgi:alanine racemase
VQTYPVAHIDLSALKHNLTRVKGFAPDSKVMSVIKANAYGHGDIEVANALAESDAFAVARLSEGLHLRQAGINKKIVILEGIHTADQLQLAAENDLSPVFHNRSQIALLSEIELIKPLQFCWLMIETGMHRLGVTESTMPAALATLKNSQKVIGEIGLMSHFANADIMDDNRNQQQLNKMLQAKDTESAPISMANSAAIISLSDSHQQWVRPGIMLYGSSPFDDKTADDLNLKPVMKLTAQLIAIEQLKAGDEVGYGGDWKATKNMKVGTVNIGYGDGYSRQCSNNSKVWLHNQLVSVLGRVSMDMICIDLSSISSAEIGDEVTLWGVEAVPIDRVAKQANTISYELLCQLNQRVTRQYHG